MILYLYAISYKFRTVKYKIMEIITSSKFRECQKDIFEKIDKGVEVIITRGANSYRLLPLEKDIIMTKEEMINKINVSLEQFRRGEYTVVSAEEQKQFLGL